MKENQEKGFSFNSVFFYFEGKPMDCQGITAGNGLNLWNLRIALGINSGQISSIAAMVC